MIEELVDVTGTVEPWLFHELANDDRYSDMNNFDWDTELAAASELPEPWQWDWKSPLRVQLEQLVGSPDVTGWTQGAGSQLAAVLAAPPEMHASLLGFREAETGLLPAVDTASAAGDGHTLPLP